MICLTVLFTKFCLCVDDFIIISLNTINQFPYKCCYLFKCIFCSLPVISLLFIKMKHNFCFSAIRQLKFILPKYFLI